MKNVNRALKNVYRKNIDHILKKLNMYEKNGVDIYKNIEWRSKRKREYQKMKNMKTKE